MTYETELDAVASAMAGYCACGRHYTDLCDLCQSVTAVDEPGQSAEEQIERRVDSIVRELDEFCALARNPETQDLIASQAIGIGQVRFRAELILSFLDARKAPTLRIVHRG